MSKRKSAHVLVGGYKATLHSTSSFSSGVAILYIINVDQNTSDDAKKHAREILNAAGIHEQDDPDDQQHQTRVLAGYKAALHSKLSWSIASFLSVRCLPDPKVSEEAKQHAREYLGQHEIS